MRSVSPFGRNDEKSAQNGASGGKLGTTRGHSFGRSTTLLAMVGVLGTPIALYLLAMGAVVPFLVSAITVSAVMVTVVLRQRAQYGRAAAAFAMARSCRLKSSAAEYDNIQLNTYRHLVENLQHAVLRFSSAGEMLFASHSTEQLFGCPRYELSRSRFVERLHVLDRPKYLTALADAHQEGKLRVLEARMRRDDPESRTPQFIWVEIALSPVIEAATPDRSHEVVVILRDITERKDLENELRHKRQEAEDASVAKSRFLATIGHELRTPLNAVVGFSEMMTAGIGGELSDTNREYATLIQQSGQHLLEVVAMLLDMSRIEAGKFELQTEVFAPEGLVAPSLKIVEPMARTRNVTILTDVQKDLPAVVADERACRQVIINLVANAIKFSHDGGSVMLGLKRQGQSLAISVRDHGIGMSAESLARLGEPFFQAEQGLSRKYEGTGLGLSIVKGLVELHGGTMRAISELGEGTTITVLLPVNGPAIKSGDTASVTPIRREPVPSHSRPWHDLKRKAQ